VCIVYGSMTFVNTGVVFGQQKTPLFRVGFVVLLF